MKKKNKLPLISPLDKLLEGFNRDVTIRQRECDEFGMISEDEATDTEVIYNISLAFNDLTPEQRKAWEAFYDASEHWTQEDYEQRLKEQWEPMFQPVSYYWLNTENVNKQFLNVEEWLDAYGSGLVSFKDKSTESFYIFNDYGDNYRRPMQAATVLILRLDWVVEFANIVYDMEAKKFVLADRMIGDFPLPMRKYSIDNFTGKRAFYVNIEEGHVDLRVNEDVRKQLPPSVFAGDMYSRNLSGNRVRVKLNPVA